MFVEYPFGRGYDGHAWIDVPVERGTPRKRKLAVNGIERALFRLEQDLTFGDQPWQPATLDAATTREKYAWKFFNYTWNGATPGEHTVTSRATDVNGVVQPTAEELEVKRTFLEHNAQLPRTVMIA